MGVVGVGSEPVVDGTAVGAAGGVAVSAAGSVGAVGVTVVNAAGLVAAASVAGQLEKQSGCPSQVLFSSGRAAVAALAAAGAPSGGVSGAVRGQAGLGAAANDKGVASVALASYKGFLLGVDQIGM